MIRIKFCVLALQALEDTGAVLESDEQSGLKEILAQVVVDQEKGKK
jgi:hypothetical protein